MGIVLPGMRPVRHLDQRAQDETPLRITVAQLRERVPALTAAATGQAIAAGLLVPLEEDYFGVRSPALLALVPTAYAPACR